MKALVNVTKPKITSAGLDSQPALIMKSSKGVRWVNRM